MHEGPYLHDLLKQGGLTQKCAWVMGHEGQGVSAEIMALVTHKVRIAQPGGEESLNAAAAAACAIELTLKG